MVQSDNSSISCESINSDNKRALAYLSNCTVKEVLGANSSEKAVFLLLEKESEGQAILILNKTAFSEVVDDITQLVHNIHLTTNSKNDIFANYSVTVPPEMNTLKSQLIHPVTENLIAKYRTEEKYVVQETPEDYETITKAYIEKYQNSLQWVYNILDKMAEKDRMIYNYPDPQNGFILLQDIKWDGKRIECMYCLAIVHRRGIKSVRDLTGDDIPMLKDLKEKCFDALNSQFGIRKDQIKAYFHYQPSFYHLHVHMVNLKYDAPGSTTLSAILFDDVVNNLSIDSDYYKKATISFTRKKNDNLIKMFQEANRIEQ